MKATLLRLMSHDACGLVVAAIFLVAGFICVLSSGSIPVTAIATGLMVVGGLGSAGALRHIVRMARIRACHPAPGRRVNVGGFRVHVLAEGDRKGHPPVVWIPGAHSGGFALHHLHRLWREEGRSILIDRPGTGWSDAGTFPRTTAKEAVEMLRALEGAGEAGPFILAGHSFGGLLAANIARRFPERIAAVVLLDATPLETIVFGPPLPSRTGMSRNALKEAVRRLFGLGRDPMEQLRREHPEARAVIDRMSSALGPEAQPGHTIELGTRAMCAAASIFEELTPEGAASAGWDTSVYDGDLGELRVFVVAPRDAIEVEVSLQSTPDAPVNDESSRTAERARRFYARSRERYLAVSSRARRIYAPAGTGHNFPYETPEFVIEVVREAASQTTDAQSSAAGATLADMRSAKEKPG